jgi:thiol-disulfide isomerase/thioredoxin
MKIKTLLPLFAALALVSSPARAQMSTDPAISSLVQQVNDQIKAGKNTEAALTNELQTFDTLIAAHQKDAQPDAAAELLYLKAMLYLQVFDNPEKGGELMKQIATNYGSTKYGQSAAKIQDKVSQMAVAKKTQGNLTAGAVFPDFSEQDLDGKPLSVAALKGKVVLVDFWATWCGPCRAELPNVIATYQKHHAEGFEIIGVSLDEDRDKLTSFLKQQSGMTWPQFFDGKGWSNKLGVKYGVDSIPFDILVGTDGKIIGTSLRGEELEAAVAQAVAKK